jgi:hypothetical protein
MKRAPGNFEEDMDLGNNGQDNSAAAAGNQNDRKGY